MTHIPREQLGDGESVRSEVTVPLERSLAYDRFTAQFGTWWPHEYHLGEDATEFVLQAHTGGRWFERSSDGTHTDWGQVVGASPPYGISLTWAIDARWRPSPSAISDLEVTFDEVPEGTRVVLQHSHLERAGEGWQELRDQLAGDHGWGWVLSRFAGSVEQP